MERTDKRYSAYIAILREELIPAMGCTEPIALARKSSSSSRLRVASPRSILF